MSINQHGGLGAYVVDRFEAKDLGAPFRVILNKAVEVEFDEVGHEVGYTIPNPDGLIRIVVIKRLLHNRKLSGADIRFIRKAVGVKQKEMAQKIEMSHEHLSRCESGALVLSPSAEKLLRVYALKMAIKLHDMKGCKEKSELDDALDQLFEIIKPVAAHSADDELEFNFCLSPVMSSDEFDAKIRHGEWYKSDDPPVDQAA